MAAHCAKAQDTPTFLQMLDALWVGLLREAGPRALIKKVSVTVHRLVPANREQIELIPALPEREARVRDKAERMSRALDKINHRFGRDSVLIGMLPSDGRSFSGSKIAFTRIPDVEEFLE